MFEIRRRNRLFFALALALALTTLAGDALVSQEQAAPARNRRVVVLDGREVVEGEVIVRYVSQTGQVERERAEFQAYSDASEGIGRAGTRRLRSRQLTTRQMLAALRANPDVEYAEPNYIIRALATPNDTELGSLWGLLNTGQVVDGQAGVPGADIGAVAAWDFTTGSPAAIVAILDSGIDFNHPDLAANTFRAPRQFSVTIGTTTVTCMAGTRGFDATKNNCVPIDENGHGTHVAGIIGAVGNNSMGVTGVNWTANLMALRVLGADGTGTTADAIRAINWAIKTKAALGADANIRVLNASWGGSEFSQALNDEIVAANNADMLFVAAAGSDGTNNDAMPHYPASSTNSNVVSVTAADNRGELAPFANYGATSVDLAAPAIGILSTFPNNTYGELSGTSMSAAFASGAAALVLSACPMSTAALKSQLLSSVDPVGSMAGKTVSGGRLNVATAIEQCVSRLDASISGSTITATVSNGPGSPGDWLGLYCPVTSADGSYSDWMYLNGTRTMPAAGLTNATVAFPAPAQSGVACNVRLFSNNTFTKLATSETVTTGSSSAPTVSVASTTVAPGAPIHFSVSNGPANRTDWVALVPASAPDGSFVDWQYLNGQKTAPATGISSATLQFTAPTTTGAYNIRFFANNSYTKLATSVTITVSSSAPPPPTLTIGDVTVSEGTSGTSVATFTVTLAPVHSSQTVTVNFATADGSATAGTDYVATSGALTFAPSTATRAISVSVNGDTVVEPNETFSVNLSNAAHAVIGDAQAIGTITNDDAASGASVTVASTTVAPGATIQFTVSGGPANATDWVALVPASSPDSSFVNWQYLNGQKTAPATGVSGATLTFPAPTTPGSYNIRFFANNSYTKLATSATITVSSASSSGPSVSVASTTVARGAIINFTVSGGPGNRADWVALAHTSAPDNSFIDWKYLNGQKTAPAAGVTGATLQFTAPTTPGTYNVRFFADNGYSKLATSAMITVP